MTENNFKYIWQKRNWTDFFWQSEELISLLGEARQAQGKILAKGKSLGFELSQEAQAEILVEETVKTSAIEGEILNRDSVRSSVARRLGLSEAGLPLAERHVDGLVEVLLNATEQYDEPLTAKRLKSWHAALFPTGYSGLHKIRVGEWREGTMEVLSGRVGHEKVHFQAPPSDVLNEEIKRFLNWWRKSFGKTEGLLRAGVAHLWYNGPRNLDHRMEKVRYNLTNQGGPDEKNIQSEVQGQSGAGSDQGRENNRRAFQRIPSPSYSNYGLA